LTKSKVKEFDVEIKQGRTKYGNERKFSKLSSKIWTMWQKLASKTYINQFIASVYKIFLFAGNVKFWK